MIFFRPNATFSGEITLNKEEIEHLRSLRLNDISKTIEVRDGKGVSYFFQVESKSKTGKLLEKKTTIIPNIKIEIASAIPKAQRLDFLLQKGTEIGVTAFYFINFFQSERREINLERSNKIILEAASQCQRHSIPTIKLYNSLEKFLQENKQVFVLNPEAKELLSLNQNWGMIPIIGPEGGFRQEELELLQRYDAKNFSIGNNILKIETAHTYIASILAFQKLVGE
ncbi:MAG: 16S rRNA (uracil(1498)-N(3))-methyltransferase [Leptospiraceae bacterium]|nr:16S rRNA (uracil(1498)-N(3))-methyltransferase [Leptospiraceae bacterium]